MSGCGPVVFDYATWGLRYPELAPIPVGPDLAQLYFDEATLYLNNTPSSPVQSISIRAMILGMLTAHIAELNRIVNGEAANPLVGRITNASQGSVSVSADMGTVPGTAVWFLQSRYGAAAYQALAPYRTARYAPGRQPYLGVSPGRYGRGFF